MAENVVFQNPQTPQAPPSITLGPTPPSSPPPSVPDDSGKFSFITKRLVIKVLIGVVLLALMLFVFFRFLLPLFGGRNDKDVTLTYWGLWEEASTVQPLLDEFHRANPHITVKYEKRSKEDYKRTLITRIDNGTGPDIFRFHNSWTDTLNGYLAALPENVIKPDEFQKNYFTVVQKDVVRKGAIYGLPFGIDTLALFVNPEILRSGGHGVPKTWIDFEKVARGDDGVTVYEPDGSIRTSGAALGTYKNVTHASDIMALLFLQNGAKEDDLTAKLADSSTALEYYISFGKGEKKTWDGSLDSSLRAFAQGRVAMYFGYSWDIFAIKALNPDFVFSVHPVPNLGEPQTIASYWIEGVSAKTVHPEATFAFMAFLAKKETQQQFFSLAAKSRPEGAQFGPPYARRDLAQTLKDNELIYPFVEQADSASFTFFSSDTFDEYNNSLNQYLQTAIDSALGNSSYESTIQILAKGVKEVTGR